MSTAPSLAFFTRHELRLAWRDFVAMMAGRRRNKERSVIVGLLVIALVMHGIAFLFLGRSGGIAPAPDLEALIMVTSGALLSGSAMLSQAMESVTRAFYSRSD